MKVLIVLSLLVAGAFAFLDCDANQHWESCGTACPLTCKNVNDPPKGCVLMCNPGCHCDKGYVKTESGDCVKPENCPSQEVCTGENQRYNGCGTACPLTCDNYQNPPIACTKQCVIGCECKEGYVKDIQGRCVLPENCPATSFSANLCELPSETGMCRGYFPRFHFNKASGQCEKFIYGGCGGNGNNFETLEECQSSCAAAANEVCGENEEFSTCDTACPLTCDNLNNPPKICTDNCVIGCRCTPGFVKNAQGKCVLPEQCPASAANLCELPSETGMCRGYFPRFHFNKASGQCEKFIYGGCGGNGNNFKTIEECQRSCAAAANEVCGENEEFSECDTACPLTCDNLNNPPKICTLQCVIGCRCTPGYVKNAQGKCVLPEQCPSFSANLCELPSETGMCRGYFPRFHFNKASSQCEEFIYGGCGGNENNFETLAECESSCAAAANEVCGENEEFSECDTACPLTCDNLNNPPKICTLQCVIGCRCTPGYVKNAQGKCVLPEQCPASAFNRNLCELPSETGMCKGAFPRFHFNKATGQCERFIYGGCGGNGNNFQTVAECETSCVAPPAKDVCGENEYFAECGSACPLTCDNLNNPPKACTLQCVIGCRCTPGYVKNAQGKCVLPHQCPQSAVCGENQEFTNCGTACPLTCQNYDNPPKFCTKQCVIGCACQKGYVKSFDGSCVLPEDCPTLPSAELSLCELPKETGVCFGYFPRFHFNKASGQCEKFIYGGCGGNGNNFKTLEQCQSSCAAAANAVCGENSRFTSCGTACPLTCDNHKNPPNWCTLQCVIGCECEKGYVKNADGKCVLPEQCEAVQRLDRPDCDKGAEVGECRARIERYYYDQEAGMCKTFIYGGCGGNRNNFGSRDECLNKCGAL